MATSWARKIQRRFTDRCECRHGAKPCSMCEAEMDAVDRVIIPPIKRLVEATKALVASRDAGDLYDDSVRDLADNALASISPADMAEIERA